MAKGAYSFYYDHVQDTSDLAQLRDAATIFEAYTYLSDRSDRESRPRGMAETRMSGNIVSGYDLRICYLGPDVYLRLEPDKAGRLESEKVSVDLCVGKAGLELILDGKRFRPRIVEHF